MRITAIDPGPTRSALIVWESGDPVGGPPHVVVQLTEANDFIRYHLREYADDLLAIEMIASYGMAVGAEVFETCVWIGRFIECRPEAPRRLVLRREVKLNLCHDTRAKDSNIRQAIIDRFGGKEKAIGKKHSPGPLYGIKGDEWSALAVALTCVDTTAKPNPDRPPF